MKSAREAFAGAVPEPSPGAAALLADLLLLARDWESGRMPPDVLRRQMTPRERWSARMACPFDGSDDDLLLRRLFEALVKGERTARDGARIVTRHGVFTQAEWRAARFGDGR